MFGRADQLKDIQAYLDGAEYVLVMCVNWVSTSFLLFDSFGLFVHLASLSCRSHHLPLSHHYIFRNTPLIIHGETGSGVTALASMAVVNAKLKKPQLVRCLLALC